MQLSTIIDISKPNWNISYSDQLLFIGSCFSQNMYKKMSEYYFRVACNPFGELYNPISICNCLSRLVSGNEFCMDELVEHAGLFHSMMHHGDFSHTTQEATLKHINRRLQDGRNALKNASVIIITLGSAYVYELNGNVVGNCHKLPSNLFVRKRLSIDETHQAIATIINVIHDLNADARIIFTVSPVRHVKDGLHENQISKSTLLCALDYCLSNLDLSLQSNVSYFPSYEIMMDELRDYRYYANDFVHPSELAVNYIWDRFTNTYCAPSTQKEMISLHQLWLDRNHIPLHPDTMQYLEFKKSTEQKLCAFQEKYPWIN